VNHGGNVLYVFGPHTLPSVSTSLVMLGISVGNHGSKLRENQEHRQRPRHHDRQERIKPGGW
jgi:hypothetical protein